MMDMQLPNIRFQNLLSFTVQIRDAQNRIIGTGFIVSSDGKIATCAHVLRAVGVEPRLVDDTRINIYFPKAVSRKEKQVSAKIIAFSECDDDVVLLQLLDLSLPLPPEQVAVLGRAEDSFGHPFRCYGYRPLPPFPGGWAEGQIRGEVDPPFGKELLVGPIELRTDEIDSGMSGSAILDIKRNLVVGIVSWAYYTSSETGRNYKVAWAINAGIFGLDPFQIPIREVSLPLRPAPYLTIDVRRACAITITDPGKMLHGAPPPLLVLQW